MNIDTLRKDQVFTKIVLSLDDRMVLIVRLSQAEGEIRQLQKRRDTCSVIEWMIDDA